MPKCYWWNRWYHRRQREADILFLLPSFQAKAVEVLAKNMPESDKEFIAQRDRLVDELFKIHKELPGQEYWHCDCAKIQDLRNDDEIPF